MRTNSHPSRLKMLAAASAFAVAAFAQPAFAAQFFPGTTGTAPDGSSFSFTVSGNPFAGDEPVSGSIARDGLTAGTFLDEFFFRIDGDGLGSGSLITTLAGVAGGATDVDFNSVTFFNGFNNFVVPIAGVGGNEFASISNVPIFSGVQNVLRVNFTSRGQGSFGGQLSFQPTAPVPEPGTWALMLLGFGAIGFAMRRRKQEVRVKYAF